MKRTSRFAAAAALTWVVVLCVPLAAHATASPKIAGVEVLPGGGTVSSGGTVAGAVRISVSATDSFNMSAADLQARFGSGTWYCLRHWQINTTSFSGTYDWDTTTWPDVPAQSGVCSGHSAATATKNTYVPSGSSPAYYQLRLTVKDSDPTSCGASSCAYSSSVFKLNVANPAEAPKWDAPLEWTGVEDDGTPIVNVQWKANLEPDVVEYHWVRANPDGSEVEFAVGGDGCYSPASGVLACGDDNFPTTGYSGTYTYALIAYRPSGNSSVSCQVPPYDGSTYGPACVESLMSEPQTVALDEPTPSPTGTPTSGSTPTGTPSRSGGRGATRVEGKTTHRNTGSRGPNTDYQDFFTGSYNKNLPYGSQQGYGSPSGSPSPTRTIDSLASGASDGDAEQTRRIWRSVAGGLALLLAAAHISRLLRRA